MAKLKNYELVLTGTQKTYQNNVKINEENITWSEQVPSKEFIIINVDDNGNIESSSLILFKNKLDLTKNKYIINIACSGKLINKSSIKSCFLREHTLTEENLIYKQKTTDLFKSGIKYQQQNPPKFYSDTYKLRCSSIQCKWGELCDYKNSKERRCFFKH